MPTRILLADDSMTAQKLGKDILLAAGYDVTAVSNGAVAAKKLADKFDIVILDINMPGYTGIELCEKIRANMDIAKTPVLLTIGKMEHYEPADAQRVKADGVIIKPFEATDLLAAVQKLEKKAAPPAVPDYEKTVIFKASDIQEFKDQSYADWKSEAAEDAPAPPATSPGFDMTHAQASAPAFGMDFDNAAELTSTPSVNSPVAASPSFAEAIAAPGMSFETAAPAMGFDMPSTPAFEVAPEASTPAFGLSPIELERAAELLTQPSPAFEAPSPVPTFEPTMASAAQITSASDPNLDLPTQGSSAAYAIPLRDPALAERIDMAGDEFVTKIGTPETETDPLLASADESVSAIPESVAVEPTDMEFEARVAAAMSGLDAAEEVPTHISEVEAFPEAVVEHAVETEALQTQMTSDPRPEIPIYEKTQLMEARTTGSFEKEEIVPDEALLPEAIELEASQETPDGMRDAALVEQMQAAFADLPIETAPHIVEEPVALSEPAPEVAPPSSTRRTTGHDLELASALAAAVGAEVPAPSALAAAASVGSGKTLVDSNLIAAAVHRAMAKMMPAIMTEVARELDSDKE